VDGKAALRANPDADEAEEAFDVKTVNGGPPNAPAKANGTKHTAKEKGSDSPLSDDPSETPISMPAKKQKTPTKSSITAKKGSDEIKAFKAGQAAGKAAGTKVKKEDADEWGQRVDPDGDEAGPVEDVDVLKREVGRPPPVNSDYLPLPWKGRLGYVSFLVLYVLEYCMLICPLGVPQHIPPILKPTRIQLSNLPYCLNPRTSVSVERSYTA
jgi:UV DNA damage endonuclease